MPNPLPILPSRKLLSAARVLVLLSLALAASVFLPASPALADVAPPESPPGINVVPGSETTQVRMLAETVTLLVKERSASKWPGQAKVTAVFTMQNLGEAEEQMEARFPLSFTDLFFGYPEIDDLQVKVNGRPVATRRINAINEFDRYAEKPTPWSTFDVTFPPGKDVQIEVTYTADGFGEASFLAFRYIVATGAGWKGTIGSADFIVQLPYEANPQNVVFAHTGFSETTPGAAFSGRELRWHFENLEPTCENNFTITLIIPEQWQQVLRDRGTVEKNPKDGEAWGRLGKAYKEMSRFRRGLRGDAGGQELYGLSAEAYEQAVALKPHDSLWHYGFADLLWFHYYWYEYMAGSPDISELERVVNLLKRSLELDPKNERAQNLALDIQYSMPGVVKLDEDGRVDYLILTATPVITPRLNIETPTETPTEAPTQTALPPTETETPEPGPTTRRTTTPPLEALTETNAPSVATPAPTAQAATAVASGVESPPDKGSRLPFCAASLALPSALIFLRKRSRRDRV